MIKSISSLLFSLLMLANSCFTHAAEPQATPHPVPWEFALDRYDVTVNGKPVTVMLAAMNTPSRLVSLRETLLRVSGG